MDELRAVLTKLKDLLDWLPDPLVAALAVLVCAPPAMGALALGEPGRLGRAALGAAFALLNYAFDEIGNPALRPVRKVRTKRV